MRMSILIAGLFFVIGCSKPTAEEQYQKAEDAVKQDNMEEALRVYQSIVTEYPEHEKAEAAQFLIASIYQNNLARYQDAVNAYWGYVGNYPDARQVPTAIFLIGFLYNNELGRIDSAEAAYRLFLERYPEHEMALSAQFELEHLGMKPDEILPKDEVAVANPKKKVK